MDRANQNIDPHSHLDIIQELRRQFAASAHELARRIEQGTGSTDNPNMRFITSVEEREDELGIRSVSINVTAEEADAEEDDVEENAEPLDDSSAGDSDEDDDLNTPDSLDGDSLLLDDTDDIQTLLRDFENDPADLLISNDDEDDDVLYSFVTDVLNVPGASVVEESEPDSEPESENSHANDGDTSPEDGQEEAATDTRRLGLRRSAATALGEGQDTEAPPAKRRKTEETTSTVCTDQDCSVKCPVCMDCSHKIRREGRHLVSTQCGHVFCQGCLDAAIQHRRRCPNCRTRISRNRIRSLYL